MNSVNLIGRLTKDIDLRQTQSGHSVGTFTLAVNRNFKNQQGEYEADFIRCQVWRQTADNLAKFTKKGDRVGIEGRIETGSYDNQQGQKIYTTDVIVNQFHLIEPKNNDSSGYESNQSDYQQSNENMFKQPAQAQNQYDYNKDANMLESLEEHLPF